MWKKLILIVGITAASLILMKHFSSSSSTTVANELMNTVPAVEQVVAQTSMARTSIYGRSPQALPAAFAPVVNSMPDSNGWSYNSQAYPSVGQLNIAQTETHLPSFNRTPSSMPAGTNVPGVSTSAPVFGAAEASR